jgi:hypothetical protein
MILVNRKLGDFFKTGNLFFYNKIYTQLVPVGHRFLSYI